MATPAAVAAVHTTGAGTPHQHGHLGTRPLIVGGGGITVSHSAPSLTFNTSSTPMPGDYRGMGSHVAETKGRVTMSSAPLWTGSWVDEDSPFFDLTTTSFPLLPRAPVALTCSLSLAQIASSHCQLSYHWMYIAGGR
jgi:hypothetical protein